MEAQAFKGKRQRNAHLAWWMKSEGKARMDGMITMALSQEGIPVLPDEMDQDGWLFNCLNGTLDLRTGQLREHRSEDLITQLCPLAYDPAAQCPLWESTLELFLPELDLIAYLQRIVGCAMVGLVRDHILPIAYGTGANGKSTIVGALIDVFGPDYAMKCAPDLLMAKYRDQHPTERTDLFRKRLVVAIETESGRRLNETMVKELTGGDRIRARRMREDFWEFVPTHTIVMATNHKPLVRGADHGIWRRLKLIPFRVTMSDEQADKEMPEKLRAEFPGILTWCVRGCLQWQQTGLDTPTAVSEATDEYQSAEDRVGAFLEEKTRFDPKQSPDHDAQVRALFQAYSEWAKAGNEFVMSEKALSGALEERGFKKYKNDRMYFRGLRLLP
jgi:putative DNA primase/helicase